MGRPIVVVELEGEPQVVRDLATGGVFAPGCDLHVDVECDLVVRAPGGEMTVIARVVWSDERGAGLHIAGCEGDLRDQLLALLDPAPAPAPDEDEDEDEEARRIPLNVHERLRGLNLAQQVKMAHTGEMHERIVLERLYHKTVWEALLRNPRITGPEVARIARIGAVPRVLLEVIVGNGGWLQIPEVRRALLSNPRLGTDQILRVLRLLPRHELKLAAVQTAYPFAVREAARKMLRDA